MAMPTTDRRLAARRGFTLTELLVVITIILIVVALVIVATGKVVDLTRTMRCMGHQRQLAVGWNTYATDNKGRIVSPRTDPFCTANINSSCGNISPSSYQPYSSNVNIQNQCWVKSWGSNMNPNGTEKRQAIETGKMFPYVGDLAVYRSPNDPSATTDIDTIQPSGSPAAASAATPSTRSSAATCPTTSATTAAGPATSTRASRGSASTCGASRR